MAHPSLFDTIGNAELTQVCRDLVRINTVNPPGDELAAAVYVSEYLAPYGFESELIAQGDGRATAIARLRGSGSVPALMLNGHVDVVPVGLEPWIYPPFAGTVADGKVWGRVAADMKGGVAAQLVAAKAVALAGLPLAGDLIVTATAGEEVDMSGAKALVETACLGPLQAIIVAEPTHNRLGLAERGVFQPEFTTYGKTAHGSTPELGQNAITMMLELLRELRELEIPYTPHPVLGRFTTNIGTIHGGIKVNVVPDRCTAMVDMRTVPGQDHAALLAQLEGLLAALSERLPGFRATVRHTYDLPAVETPVDAPAVKRFSAAVLQATGKPVQLVTVRFATEGAIFVPALAVPTLILGPGDPDLAHQPNENVEIARMAEAARIYAAAAAELLSQDTP